VVMTATATAATTAPATTAVVASSLIAITPPHALVLSVSHGLPVAGSCLRRFPAGSFTQLSPAFQVLLSKSCFPSPNGQAVPRWSETFRPARVACSIRTLVFVRWPLRSCWPHQSVGRDPAAAALVSQHARFVVVNAVRCALDR